MSVLWGTFGGDTSCIVRFLESNKDRPHLLQIHLSNESCRRNGNCKEGELRGDLSRRSYSAALEAGDLATYQQIAARMTEIRNLVEQTKNSNTTLVLSTGLEDNYSPKAYSNLRAFLAGYWPYLFSRSGRAQAPGDLLERHGTNAKCKGEVTIVNEDGDNPSARQSRRFLQRNRACFARFLWRSAHQGRKRNRWSTPLSRTFEISDRDIDQLGKILEGTP